MVRYIYKLFCGGNEMSPIDTLNKYSEDMVKAGESLINTNAELAKSESVFTVLKAKMLSMDRVVHLSNQVMRDAEVSLMLETDDRFNKQYRKYLSMKLQNREDYIRWDLSKELCKNQRAIVQSL